MLTEGSAVIIKRFTARFVRVIGLPNNNAFRWMEGFRNSCVDDFSERKIDCGSVLPSTTLPWIGVISDEKTGA